MAQRADALAIGSTAFHSSVYCAMNMACRLLNMEASHVQWKCVVRYRGVGCRQVIRPLAMAARSSALMPMFMPVYLRLRWQWSGFGGSSWQRS